MKTLLRYRKFRALFAARTISAAGDALGLVALMLHVATTAGSALAVAALLLAADFVPSLFAPLAGALADRVDRRRLMIGCEVVQALLVAAIALTLPPLVPLLVLVALRSVAGQFFQPSSRAAVPALVPDADLVAANSTLGFGTNAAELGGPLLAALLFPLVGLRGVLWIDAVSFGLSALLLIGLPRLRPAQAEAAGDLSDKTDISVLWRHPVLRVVALGFVAVVFCTGVDDVALVVLAKDTFALGDSLTALLLGAIGVGLLAGFGLLSGWKTVPLQPLLVAGFAVSAAGNLLTGLAGGFALAFGMQAARGLGIAAIDVAINTLVPRLVPDALLGRVFANLYGAVGAAAALSYLAGGALLDATSAPTTLVVAGAAGVSAAALTGLALVRTRVRRVD